MTRLPYCSPYRLFWSLFNKKTPSDRIYAHYSTYIWRSGNPFIYMRIFAYCVLWPVAFLAMQWRITRRLGPQVRRATGKSVLRQMAEQLRLAVLYSLAPNHYYSFELFRDERRALAGDYILRYQLKHGLYHVLARTGQKLSRDLLSQKVHYAEFCHDRNIRAVRALLLLHADGRLEAIAQETPALPKQDIFTKPAKGRGGKGCERFDYDAAQNRYASTKGDYSPQELLAYLQERSKDLQEQAKGAARPIIIQEALQNHPDFADLSDRALISARIMSAKDEEGKILVTHAVFKMSTRKGQDVDNFHAGGLAARVDMETGVLGPASHYGLRAACEWFDHHPVTGALITGRKLPFWPETVELVRRAHETVSDRIIVGWDVAICPDGPCIIEANSQSGFDMMQRTHALPIGQTAVARLYAHHLDAAFDIYYHRKPRPLIAQPQGT